MTVNELRADYAVYTDGNSLESDTACERIMSAMPKILDVLEIVDNPVVRGYQLRLKTGTMFFYRSFDITALIDIYADYADYDNRRDAVVRELDAQVMPDKVDLRGEIDLTGTTPTFRPM